VIRERDEALEQQAAISDILRVISNSPSDVQPVLDSVAQHTARICEAHIVDIAIADNKVFRIAASFGKLGRLSSGETAPLDRSTVTGRSICDLQPVHIADMESAGDEFPLGREFAARFRHRTILAVPLIREGRALGAILVRRIEVRPFEENHIALLKAFADQAAIAIENVRLFKAEQQRTHELTEALEQQTATSEVLQVISTGSGQLEPVFATMLENAVHICDAKFGTLYRVEGDGLRLIATHDVSPAFAEAQGKEPFHPAPGGFADTVMKTGRTVHLPDLTATPAYVERHPRMMEAVEIAGIRTVVGVPMLKDAELIGIIGIYRQEVRPFTDKQIELLTNFAAQAVIAIENTRLLSELRESLEQQTATADVLKVISRSAFNLKAVLNTLIESAVRLCAADMGIIFQQDGDAFRLAANYGFSPEAVQYAAEHPVPIDRGSTTGRALLEGRAIHIPDVLADPEYRATRYQELAGYRSTLSVPLLRDGTTIGIFALSRTKVNPFTDKQIELATTFADQAVIAIENVRLFEAEQQRTRELTESLQQQTATADVLKVISRSTFDLQPVLDALVETAARLCQADVASITNRDGEVYRVSANFAYSPELQVATREQVLKPGRDSISGRAVLECQVVHVADLATDPEYALPEMVTIGNIHTALGVPLLREGQPIGTLFLARQRVEPFTERQMELAATFADQAVIAIENVRLFEAEQQRTRELSESLQQQTATADVLKAVSRSTFDLPTVLSSLVESAVRLCKADMAQKFLFCGQLGPYA
jgi:GAF domain-containing protein